MNKELSDFINLHLPKIEKTLVSSLATLDAPPTLLDSMNYSTQAGGKRVRPLLFLATLEDLHATSEDAYTIASAIEFIHTYSLIHDDLPSMDDDDYRRGKLTNHKVYGEAIAVLAGDALQTVAFQLLSSLTHTPAEKSIALLQRLSIAAGPSGMIGGQVLDMEGEHTSLQLSELESVHKKKTGALLSYCIEAGALLADCSQEDMEQLKDYAHHIGLAFQIRDDILDVISTTEELGKTAGSDAESEKSTYPALLGLDGAHQKLDEHHRLAIQSLSFLKKEQTYLSLFADYIVGRRS